MNETKCGAWPNSWEELANYVNDLESQNHDYNSIADSLSKATVAMFNYFASKHGMTGFQASWAGLQFLRTTRGMDGPFAIIDGSKLLYPQYNIHSDINKWIEEWKPELGRIAKKKLEEDNKYAHPNVIKRWQELSKYAQVEETK
ncbi:hypothetical protein BRE01_67510 [Brevibacillus reuszeri]|uniref:Uncharacterized protein n=1 Tax=Brevibacillus reuszeri TaxID=54915 RepID=A0A0K9YNA7_9BACL|nr:hypothetical protein [Brevibacillus reuszeri]KNB70199.1 hypothetical protein ADS79_14615 [Brevibacillus reuszeri]GED73049.1 hypothetical protein BRE01_67510 [Brevibacillus reuszeri]